MTRTIAQSLKELTEIKEARLHIELSNTYLRVERGEEPLTITNSQRMLWIVGKLYGDCDRLSEYWMTELQELPNWLNI